MLFLHIFFPQNLFALSLNEPHNVDKRGAVPKLDSPVSMLQISSCLLFWLQIPAGILPLTPPWVSHPYSVVFNLRYIAICGGFECGPLIFCKAPCVHTPRAGSLRSPWADCVCWGGTWVPSLLDLAFPGLFLCLWLESQLAEEGRMTQSGAFCPRFHSGDKIFFSWFFAYYTLSPPRIIPLNRF